MWLIICLSFQIDEKTITYKKDTGIHNLGIHELSGPSICSCVLRRSAQQFVKNAMNKHS